MKIDNVVSSQEITTKSGLKLTKTTFLSGGQAYTTFSKVVAGEEREEESRRESNYNGNKEITIKFKPKGGGFYPQQGGGSSRRSEDYTTMLMAYAKDIAIAGLANGTYKSIQDTLKAFDTSVDVIIAKYKKLQQSGSEAVEQARNTVSASTSVETPPAITDADDKGDDINLEELPF